MHSAGAIPLGDSGIDLDSLGRRSPLNRSPFTTPQPNYSTAAETLAFDAYQPSNTSPSVNDVSSRGPAQQAAFIQFDPYATSMTPSRFINQESPWLQPSNEDARHWAPMHSPTQLDHAPVSLASSAPASSYFQMLAQQRMTPSPKLPESLTMPNAQPSITRSHSADSRISNRSPASPYTPRTLPPRMQECLTEEEQARVLANAAPAVYDVTGRAYALRLQQEDSQAAMRKGPSSTGPPVSLTGRQRRQSMPTPPSGGMGRFSPIDAGGSSRSNKTPPLAPSSRFIVQLPFVPATTNVEQDVGIAGLETIGEDGESQAGTIRFGKGTLGRSASHEQIRSLKAVRAVNAAVDEEGNTSVTLLEGIAERQDREKKEANRREELENQSNILAGLDPGSLNLDKTLPKEPPSPRNKVNSSPEEASKARKGIFDIFPEINSTNTLPSLRDKSLPHASPLQPSSQSRAVTNPASSMVHKPDLTLAATRPGMTASKSDSLLALESRLSRPASPMSPTSGESRPPSLSPPPRSEAASPLQRAISPVHIGNQGALRKKSSQISLKRQEIRQKAETDQTASVADVKPSANLLVEMKSSKPASATTPRPFEASESKRLAGRASMDMTVHADSGDARAKLSSRAQEVRPKSKAVQDAKETGVHSPTVLMAGKASAAVGTKALSRSTHGKSPALELRNPGRPLAASSPSSSKRHTSDPQTSSAPQAASKVAGLAGRRQSLDIPPDPVDKFGSARGGRGGVVTSVASLWADIISQEAKNAKNQAILAASAPTAKQSKRPSNEVPTSQSIPKARDQLQAAVINADKPKAANSNDAADKKRADISARVKAELLKPNPQAPKARQAALSINATIGKPPTFAKPLESLKASSAASSTSRAPEQGATNLKALIAKFS